MKTILINGQFIPQFESQMDCANSPAWQNHINQKLREHFASRTCVGCKWFQKGEDTTRDYCNALREYYDWMEIKPEQFSGSALFWTEENRKSHHLTASSAIRVNRHKKYGSFRFKI